MAYQQSYDQYYIYHPPPHPHPLPPPLPPLVSDEPGAINTLFVSGLPSDVKAREIHNLFRRRPGFESCQLKYTGRGDQVVAFATFSNHRSALAAMNALNGVRFDPQTGSVLHIELARSNSRRKDIPGSGPYVVIDNRNKESAKTDEGQSNDGDSDSDEEDEPCGGDSVKESSNATRLKDIAKLVRQALILIVKHLRQMQVEAISNVLYELYLSLDQSENPVGGGAGTQACSTLFIANLGPNCTEDELKQVLSRYPGFNTLKMRARGGMPVAFADFEEMEQATNVMNDLQGTLLTSSDRGGMHIEYARSKMRKR